jgi:hypothetical protein
MTHSEIIGPWIPDEVVRGISVSVYIKLSLIWSVPALKKCINLRFCAASRLSGRILRVQRMVVLRKSSSHDVAVNCATTREQYIKCYMPGRAVIYLLAPRPLRLLET